MRAARRRGRRLALLAAALALAACGGHAPPSPAAAAASGGEPHQALRRALLALDARVDPVDAERVARTAFARTAELARRYAMVRPALLHNALVRTGLRERGLCCHWAEDLLASLAATPAPSLRSYWVVAHHGSLLREHSAVAVAAAGADYRQGLVLDAWRRGGTLTWAPLGADRYPWVLHPLDAQRDLLRCR